MTVLAGQLGPLGVKRVRGGTPAFTITIDHSKVVEPLTGFPVYVNLADMPDEFWQTVSNGGGDIRCLQGDNPIPREIVSCDTASRTGELHVLADLDDTTDTILMVKADGVSTEPLGQSRQVWTDYAAVLHMGDATDSTAGTTFTVSGTPTVVAGPVADATYLAKGDKYQSVVQPGDPLMLAGVPFVYSTWLNLDGSNGDQYGRLFDKSTGGLGVNGYAYWVDFNLNKVQGRIDSSGATFDTDPLPSGWVHLTFALRADKRMQTYVNGVPDQLSSVLKFAPDAAVPVAIGDWPSGGDSRALDAWLDESRVRLGEITAGWVATEYANQSDPASFYTISKEASP